MSEKKEDKPRDVKLNQSRMKSGEFVRTLYVATVEMGTTREDLMKPEFWSQVSYMFSPYDRIEVRSDDGVFFAEYLVLACERTFAKVKELSFVSLTTKDVAMTQAEKDLELYEYKYRGPHRKHSILRKSDGAVMVEEKDTKEQAVAWLHNFQKALT